MAELSRRAVLGAGVGALGLVALGVVAPEAEAAVTKPKRPVAAKASPMSAPVRSDYAHQVGRVFTATHGGHSFRLRLTHVEDLVATTAKQRPHCFALVFAPVGRARLHDGIYVLRRKGVRTHELFISSIGTKRGMQAIVNRSH